MFCSKCGKEIREGARFCPSCGQQVDSSTIINAAIVKTHTIPWKWICIGLGIALAAVIFVVTIVNAKTSDLPVQKAHALDSLPHTSTPNNSDSNEIFPCVNPITDETCDQASFYVTNVVDNKEKQCWVITAYKMGSLTFSQEEVDHMLASGYIEFIRLAHSIEYDDDPERFLKPDRYSFVTTDDPGIIYLSCVTDDGYVDDKPWPTVDGEFYIADPSPESGISYGYGYAHYQLKKAGDRYVLRQLAFKSLESQLLNQGDDAYFLGQAYQFELPYGLNIYKYDAPFATSSTDSGTICSTVSAEADGSISRCLCTEFDSTAHATIITAKDGVAQIVESHPWHDRRRLEIHYLVSPQHELNSSTEKQSLPSATPIPMADYEWLENQPALQTKRANFVPQKWENSNFQLSSNRYWHGVGITMKGSKFETEITPESGDVWTEPYSETYLDVAFGRRFFKMTFDIGFDNAFSSRWGAPETNGRARLILKDEGANKTLYDTGVIDFAFSNYFVSVDTKDVEILRIIYQVSPIMEKQKSSLNLLLGKALVYKLGDGYENTEDYTPVLTALPTDYTQFEPYATDNIERFILRGYREKYTREELKYFSKDEMELVLNGVYALSGKWVTRAELWNYFTTKSWYYPVRVDITDDEKNNIQQANEDTIVAYMKDMGWR